MDNEPLLPGICLLDKSLDKNGVRVILQLYVTVGTTTIIPETGVYYQDSEPEAEQALETRLALVTQTSLAVKFALKTCLKNEDAQRPLSCDLYFGSETDSIVLYNTADIEIDIRPMGSKDAENKLAPRESVPLVPGIYTMILHQSRVLDIRVLPNINLLDPQNPARPLLKPSKKSLKRGLTFSEAGASDPEGVAQRIQKVSHDADDTAIILPTRISEISASRVTRNPLADLPQHGAIDIPGTLDVGTYQIHNRKIISTRSQSEVYLAQHSGINGDIIVKVLKVKRSTTSAENCLFVRAHAEAWSREYKIQNRLEHQFIVKLYGGDARFLALFMEHAPGHDLATKGKWRGTDDYFSGSEYNASRVLSDITSALEYVHEQGLEHNDIKPANILLSEERGAVLCDFGLSRLVSPVATSGGTPWYVPPEYMALGKRGQPGDMYALGVIMLYLRRRLPLPDVGKVWMIADIHSRTSEKEFEARQSMRAWLSEVDISRARLEPLGNDALIRDLLSPLRERPTAAELVRRLNKELYSTQQIEEGFANCGSDKERKGGSQSLTEYSSTESVDSKEWFVPGLQ